MAADISTTPSEAQARRLESVYEQMSTLLHQPDVVQRLRTAPGEHEWSALQVIGHMVEMIPYWLHHLCERPRRLRGARSRKSLGLRVRPAAGIIAALAHHDAVKVLCRMRPYDRSV